MRHAINQITFPIDRRRHEALKKLARRQFCSVSAVVRQAVDMRLRQEGLRTEAEEGKGEGVAGE